MTLDILRLDVTKGLLRSMPKEERALFLTQNDLYAFLVTGPNTEVGAIHLRFMLVILTTPEEFET